MSTRTLNSEPIAILGLTQSELTVVLITTLAVCIPCTFLLAVLFFQKYFLLTMVGIGGTSSLTVGWLLTLYVQARKADTPPRYLAQRLQLLLQRSRWVPPLGAYHTARSDTPGRLPKPLGL
jgi:conjugative transfer region protein (TIGR03750 family)